MNQFLTRLALLYEARNFRERLLIALTVLATTWGLWIVSLGGSAIDAETELMASIERLAQDLRLQTDERQRLLQADQKTETRTLVQEIENLEQKLRQRADELEAALGGFIAPDKVPDLLQTLLQIQSGLALTRMQSLPPEPLRDVGMEVYLHPVEMELSGSYFDVLAYLERLEQTPWELHWRRVDYVVDKYPTATIKLRVETLSDKEAWLGV